MAQRVLEGNFPFSIEYLHQPSAERLKDLANDAPLIRLASGFPYTDTTNGFSAYSSRFLADPRVALFRDVFVGYELHYYLAVQAAKLGFRCIEVPVSRIYPPTGKTPTKISPLKGNLKLLGKLLQVVLGRYTPRA